MSVTVRTSRGKIYLDIYIRGKRWWESTGLTVSKNAGMTKEAYRLAEILRAKKEMSLVLRQNGMYDPSIGKMLLVDYIAESAKGKSKRYSIHKLLEWIKKLSPNVRFEDLNAAWLERFQKDLLAQTGLSAQTCEHYCASLRRQFKLALRDKLLIEDPGAGVPHIKVDQKQKPYLETWEIEKLMATPITGQKSGIGPVIRVAWFFAVATGLRISDIKTLKWSDIDIKNQSVCKVQAKTGKLVLIPIKAEAWRLIYNPEINDAPEFDRESFVFPRLAAVNNAENTNVYLRRWGKDAGLTKAIGWHIARHTNATQLLESGADIYTVKELLGHTKIETTMKYAQVTNRARKAAIDALPDYGFEK